MKVAVSQIY